MIVKVDEPASCSVSSPLVEAAIELVHLLIFSLQNKDLVKCHFNSPPPPAAKDGSTNTRLPALDFVCVSQSVFWLPIWYPQRFFTSETTMTAGTYMALLLYTITNL